MGEKMEKVNNLDITLTMIDPEKKRQLETNIEEEIEISLGLDSVEGDLVFSKDTNSYKKFSDQVRSFIQKQI